MIEPASRLFDLSQIAWNCYVNASIDGDNDRMKRAERLFKKYCQKFLRAHAYEDKHGPL